MNSKAKQSTMMRLKIPVIMCIFLILPIFNSCKTVSQQEIKKEVSDIHLRLALMEAGLNRFEIDGPFAVQTKNNAVLSISPEESREVDLYLTSAMGKAPIVILSHGNFSGKRAHASQATRLASWGFHVVVLELPNRDQWLENGRRIFELSSFLNRWPKFLGDNVDSSKIVLVGHSFGGSAVTLAASQGAPAIGVILLDPAVVHPSVVASMSKVPLPGVLLGADISVFNARKRGAFRKKWLGDFAEISVKGATHDDAQGPSMFSNFALGFDPFTSNEQRGVFKSAIVSAAISMVTFGNLENFVQDAKSSEKIGRISDLILNEKVIKYSR